MDFDIPLHHSNQEAQTSPVTYGPDNIHPPLAWPTTAWTAPFSFTAPVPPAGPFVPPTKQVSFSPATDDSPRRFHALPKKPFTAPEPTTPPSKKRVRTKRGQSQQARPHQSPPTISPAATTNPVHSLTTSVSQLLIGAQSPADSFEKSIVLVLSSLIEQRQPTVPETQVVPGTRGPRYKARPPPLRLNNKSKRFSGPATASNALSIKERRSKDTLFPLPAIRIPLSSAVAPPKTA